MRFLLIIISLLFSSFLASGNDSLQTLSLTEFIQIVKSYHPVAKQAVIQVKKANAALLTSRSGFDPFLETNNSSKTFDGQEYYQNSNLQLSIPTWYGIQIQTGIEYLSGSRTDPQETSGQTSFAGISVPLAKNLLMDNRRAVLLQAKIMVDASEQEKKIMLNDLMKEATDSYWQWVQQYLIYKTYTDVITVNKKRIAMVKVAVTIGEKAAIDTTEALAQLQSFEYLQNESLLAFQNASVALSNFLWTENNEAYDLPDDNVIPDKKNEALTDAVIFPILDQLLLSAKSNHPELMLYHYNLKVLSIEKKLKFQELLPDLELKYNQLGKGYDVLSTATKTILDNNYRYAVHFSIPLRLSQGRGAYQTAKLKITETRLNQSLKETTILNKIKIQYNYLVTYKKQVSLLEKTYANYNSLLRGEETRFFNGESSLFMINSRENKVLESLIKLTETSINYNKSIYLLKWSAGELWNL